MGKFKAKYPAAGLDYARHLTKRLFNMRNISDAKADNGKMEAVIGKGYGLGVPLGIGDIF